MLTEVSHGAQTVLSTKIYIFSTYYNYVSNLLRHKSMNDIVFWKPSFRGQNRISFIKANNTKLEMYIQFLFKNRFIRCEFPIIFIYVIAEQLSLCVILRCIAKGNKEENQLQCYDAGSTRGERETIGHLYSAGGYMQKIDGYLALLRVLR